MKHERCLDCGFRYGHHPRCVHVKVARIIEKRVDALLASRASKEGNNDS